jgi:hypothetical protein
MADLLGDRHQLPVQTLTIPLIVGKATTTVIPAFLRNKVIQLKPTSIIYQHTHFSK